jgi:protein TonB
MYALDFNALIYRHRNWISNFSGLLFIIVAYVLLHTLSLQKVVNEFVDMSAMLEIAEDIIKPLSEEQVQPKPDPVQPPPLTMQSKQAPAKPEQIIQSPTQSLVHSSRESSVTDSQPHSISQESPKRSVESSAQIPQMQTSQPVVAAASAVSPPVVSRSKSDDVPHRFEAQLLAYLESIKRYPTSREARLTRPSGITKFWFELGRNGELINTGVAQSSGSNLLDSEALRIVRSARFPSFPENFYPNASSHRFIAAYKFDLNEK